MTSNLELCEFLVGRQAVVAPKNVIFNWSSCSCCRHHLWRFFISNSTHLCALIIKWNGFLLEPPPSPQMGKGTKEKEDANASDKREFFFVRK